MLVSKNRSFRSLLSVGLAALLAGGTVGCGSSDLGSSPSDTSVSAPASGSTPMVIVTPSARMLPSPRVVNPSIKVAIPARAPIPARFNKSDRVHAMSNGTLRIIIDVYNDDSGYAWPSANQVGHVLVDNEPWFVVIPDVYASNAYVDIPLSPGAHTVALVENYWATHDLDYSDIGNVTITSGQTITRSAYFNDKGCHPSCP